MPNRPTIAFALALLAWFSFALAAGAQTQKESAAKPTPILRVRSNVVLIPALVKTTSGEVVFSLTADDFVLTDNGVTQPLKLEPDTDSEPLALAVIVETGGDGASHLRDYDAFFACSKSIEAYSEKGRPSPKKKCAFPPSGAYAATRFRQCWKGM
jgi:hypothetical protein